MAEKRERKLVPIEFNGYKIVSLKYGELKETEEKLSAKLNVKFGLTKGNEKGIVELESFFVNHNKKVQGTIIVRGNFTLDGSLSDDDAQKFLGQNGAAMLYPYVRTIISVVTSLDDQNVSVLPSLNFVEAYQKINKVE